MQWEVEAIEESTGREVTRRYNAEDEYQVLALTKKDNLFVSAVFKLRDEPPLSAVADLLPRATPYAELHVAAGIVNTVGVLAMVLGAMACCAGIVAAIGSLANGNQTNFLLSIAGISGGFSTFLAGTLLYLAAQVAYAVRDIAVRQTNGK